MDSACLEESAHAVWPEGGIGDRKLVKLKAELRSAGDGGGMKAVVGCGLPPRVIRRMGSKKSERSAWGILAFPRSAGTHQSGDEWVLPIAEFLGGVQDHLAGGRWYAGMALQGQRDSGAGVTRACGDLTHGDALETAAMLFCRGASSRRLIQHGTVLTGPASGVGNS